MLYLLFGFEEKVAQWLWEAAGKIYATEKEMAGKKNESDRCTRAVGGTVVTARECP